MAKKSVAKILLTSGVGIFFLLCIGVAFWSTHLNSTIKERLSGKRWSAPAEFYSAPERFLKGQSQISKTLSETLTRLDYQAILIDRPLKAGEFAQWNGDLCRQKITSGVAPEITSCWAIKPRLREDMINGPPERPLQVLGVSKDDIVLEVYEGEPPQPTTVVEL